MLCTLKKLKVIIFNQNAYDDRYAHNGIYILIMKVRRIKSAKWWIGLAEDTIGRLSVTHAHKSGQTDLLRSCAHQVIMKMDSLWRNGMGRIGSPLSGLQRTCQRKKRSNVQRFGLRIMEIGCAGVSQPESKNKSLLSRVEPLCSVPQARE